MSELTIKNENDKRWASVTYADSVSTKPEVPIKITIEDGYGEFSIKINNERFYFSQEDNYKDLVKVFAKLGFKAKYKEIY